MNINIILLIFIQTLLAIMLAIFGGIIIYRAMTSHYSNKKASVFGFFGLASIVLGIMVGFGGEYNVSLTGLSGKSRSLEMLINALPPKSDAPDLPIIAAGNPKGVKAWWELSVYRIQIRLFLREIVKRHDRTFNNNEDRSMTDLLAYTYSHKLVSDDQNRDLLRFRTATHFFEWGTSGIPAQTEIEWALKSGPTLVEQLKKVN